MPYQITLNSLPAGYAASSFKKGEKAQVIVREFISSEDGDLFISRLEGLPSEIINQIDPSIGIQPGIIDHLLVIIHQDRTAIVYINELQISITLRSKRDLKAGDIVRSDDVAHIEQLDIVGIEIPEDAGFIFIFSLGWRKGFFYDLQPLSGKVSKQEYSFNKVCGQYYSYLNFQHLFKISESEWNAFFDQSWFPFVSLKDETIKRMISFIRNNWNIDDFLDDIANEVSEMAPSMLSRWKNNKSIEPHFDLLSHALERYLQSDYKSAVSIIYPRIEGIMRSLHNSLQSPNKTNQRGLVTTVIDARKHEYHEYSSLLPNMFQQFMEKVYFANFDATAAPLSRNSVAHGVASSEEFSLKSSLIGILIIDQIFFYLP
jgi:hypothetical protein